MTQATRFQLETSGTTATLYISEELPLDHFEAMCDACATLPPFIRTLRLDLHGVRRLTGETMSQIRGLMREWRALRGGECRLSFATEHLVVTYTEQGAPPAPARAPWTSVVRASDAMTAAYL